MRNRENDLFLKPGLHVFNDFMAVSESERERERKQHTQTDKEREKTERERARQRERERKHTDKERKQRGRERERERERQRGVQREPSNLIGFCEQSRFILQTQNTSVSSFYTHVILPAS